MPFDKAALTAALHASVDASDAALASQFGTTRYQVWKLRTELGLPSKGKGGRPKKVDHKAAVRQALSAIRAATSLEAQAAAYKQLEVAARSLVENEPDGEMKVAP